MQHNVENIISKIVKKISTLFYYKKICANVTLDMIELLKPEKRFDQTIYFTYRMDEY